jgi:hypothetical protein
MPTISVPREEWLAFLDSFSQQHLGWLITLEVIGPDLGDQVEVSGLPLEGVTVGLNTYGQEEITVSAGRPQGPRISHRIVSPSAVLLKRTDEGADEALEITANGERNLIRFRSAMRLELVDAI